MISYEKTYAALTLLALARFNLDLANLLVHPYTWEVNCRRQLQSEARRLISVVKAL
jgi:hypothetical protein